MDVLEKRITQQEILINNIQRELETATWQVMNSKTQLMIERAVLTTLKEQYGKLTGETGQSEVVEASAGT